MISNYIRNKFSVPYPLTATRRDAHHTRVARIPIVGVNMNILSEVEQWLGQFQQGQVTPGQLALELDRIAVLPHHYSRGVIGAATGGPACGQARASSASRLRA